MVISDFTNVELDVFREQCNFVNAERDVFELRSQGLTLEEIAGILDYTIDGINGVSKRVNRKIHRVLFPS